MKHYSNNRKLNAILNSIREDIFAIHDTEEESISEMLHYMDSFPREVDYNLAQYGNLLIYYQQIREAYKDAGYSENGTIGRMSDYALWGLYKRQVGWVAREVRKELSRNRK